MWSPIKQCDPAESNFKKPCSNTELPKIGPCSIKDFPVVLYDRQLTLCYTI